MAEVFGPVLPPRLARAQRIRQGRQTVRDFNKALSDWALTATDDAVREVQKYFAFEVLRRVVRRTPVDTGRARGGWQVTLHNPAENAGTKTDPSGADAVSSGQAVIGLAQPFQVIWISNNVEYIRILEEGGFVPPNPGPSKTGGSSSKAGRAARKGTTLVKNGYSTQAPKGMVAITLREILASGAIIK